MPSSSGLDGSSSAPASSRNWFDWFLVAAATVAFVATGLGARWPSKDLNWKTVAGLSGIGLVLFANAVIWLCE